MHALQVRRYRALEDRIAVNMLAELPSALNSSIDHTLHAAPGSGKD